MSFPIIQMSDTTASRAGNTEFWSMQQSADDYGLTLRDRASWWEATVRYDGCVDLRRAFGDPYSVAGRETSGDDYLHVCDLDEFIGSLLELRRKAREHFGRGWPV